MDELIEALLEVIELKQKRDKMAEDCDSSWDYWGEETERQLQKAKDRFGKALKIYIVENAPRGGSGSPYA